MCTIAGCLGSLAGSSVAPVALGRQGQLPAAQCPGACQTAWIFQSFSSVKTATSRYIRAPKSL